MLAESHRMPGTWLRMSLIIPFNPHSNFPPAFSLSFPKGSCPRRLISGQSGNSNPRPYNSKSYTVSLKERAGIGYSKSYLGGKEWCERYSLEKSGSRQMEERTLNAERISL